MANPKLPKISENEQALLYTKLNEYNRGRSSYKEAGVYMIALPQLGKSNYTLWLYSPNLEKQSIIYIRDLSSDIYESLRIASTMFYYSKRCLIVVDYNEKRMQSNREGLIFFGKYKGHYLHEILMIDPTYLSWISYKFTPKIPKQERFIKIARAYYSVYLDMMLRKGKEKQGISKYLGDIGEKLTDLKLKVIHIRFEDDPYKTIVYQTIPYFFVKQKLTLIDTSGNLVLLSIASKRPSRTSGTVSGLEHEYRIGEILYVSSARISHHFEKHGSKYTRLNHVRLAITNASSNHL